MPDRDKPVTVPELRRAAMDLLARREHSFHELATKLRRRLQGRPIEGGDLDSTLRALEGEGLLSDERYAASRARQLASRGYGPGRIRQDLRQQGVEEHIERSLSDACADSSDWLAHATAVYKKKYGGAPIIGDFQTRQREKAKRLRFLQYRGFDGELSRKLVSADEKDGAVNH